MGGAFKAIGKVLDVVKPFVSMINPALGMALGFAGDLMQGKSPLQAIMGAASGLIPGGGSGILGNVLSTLGGGSNALSGLMDGVGGNSLLSGALNMVGGQSGVTDVLSSLMKGTSGSGAPLTDLGMGNVVEQSAQKMAQMLLA